jgi:hypothetical protein
MKVIEYKKDCIINVLFVNSNNPKFYRQEYCEKNCQFKCLTGKKYKKIGEENARKNI